MPKQVSSITLEGSQEGWTLLRLALLTNHRQELTDQVTTDERAKAQLDQRHQHEMAQISQFLHPPGWAQAITRYRVHQAAHVLLNKTQQDLIHLRQQKELAELDQWIAKQQEQATDWAVFDQLRSLFGWSLAPHQRQACQQALSQAYTLIVTDSNQRILWTSQRFVQLTGYRPAEVVGRRPQLLQGPATDPVVLDYVRSRLRSAQVVDVELVNYDKAGVPYRCHMLIEPLCNRQGVPTHFLAIEHALEWVA